MVPSGECSHLFRISLLGFLLPHYGVDNPLRVLGTSIFSSANVFSLPATSVLSRFLGVFLDEHVLNFDKIQLIKKAF